MFVGESGECCTPFPYSNVFRMGFYLERVFKEAGPSGSSISFEEMGGCVWSFLFYKVVISVWGFGLLHVFIFVTLSGLSQAILVGCSSVA